uniref:SH3 domain-containing protein n=1 Tax=Steinernema glaseri TaxID=37863 RepID=A0A1I7YEB9_9BILA
MATFDPFDWDSFYFGNIDREEAHRLLMSNDASTLGSFLLRDSSSPGCYSLSVREGIDKIRNYLIEKIETEDGRTNMKIADQYFADIPALLNHYKMRILDAVSLTRPVRKKCIEKVVGLYKFEGERISDLPFERGEVLEVVGKPEPGWWKARNALNCSGLIPANYVQTYVESEHVRGSTSSVGSDKRYSTNSATSETSDNGTSSGCPAQGGSLNGHIRVPALVRAILDRVPSAYDTESLRLTRGDFIQLTKIEPSGICEGTLNGKRGKFPFTYVEFVREASGP